MPPSGPRPLFGQQSCLPRYGEKECYFIVQQEATNSVGVAHDSFKNLAIEGSGVPPAHCCNCSRRYCTAHHCTLKVLICCCSQEYALENLWLPFMTTLFCLIPPVLVFLSSLFEGTLRTLEATTPYLRRDERTLRALLFPSSPCLH